MVKYQSPEFSNSQRQNKPSATQALPSPRNKVALSGKPQADPELCPAGPERGGTNLTLAILVWFETPFAQKKKKKKEVTYDG